MVRVAVLSVRLTPSETRKVAVIVSDAPSARLLNCAGFSDSTPVGERLNCTTRPALDELTARFCTDNGSLFGSAAPASRSMFRGGASSLLVPALIGVTIGAPFP